MQRRDFLTLAAGLPLLAQNERRATAEIPADVLEFPDPPSKADTAE